MSENRNDIEVIEKLGDKIKEIIAEKKKKRTSANTIDLNVLVVVGALFGAGYIGYKLGKDK